MSPKEVSIGVVWLHDHGLEVKIGSCPLDLASQVFRALEDVPRN